MSFSSLLYLYFLISSKSRPPDKSAKLKKIFSYFSAKTYVIGAQKNRLSETVLLSNINIMFNLINKKIVTFLH